MYRSKYFRYAPPAVVLILGLITTSYLRTVMVCEEKPQSLKTASVQTVGSDPQAQPAASPETPWLTLSCSVTLAGLITSLLFAVVVELLIRSRETARSCKKLAEEALRTQVLEEKTRRELEAILNASDSVAIVATDLDGSVTLFNAGAERMLGYDADEIVGKHTPML